MSDHIKTLFNGTMLSSYRQLHVMSAECQELMPDDSRKGHVNGLCGGATPGGLFLTVGIHTGDIPINVELHASAPPIDHSWDEIVEASCSFGEEPVMLFGWAGESSAELAMAVGSYRVRFCAKAFGQSEAEGDLEKAQERYLLIFWPAPSAADAILKQTSDEAAYWHQVSRDENL